jgi:predicted ABC-class ATPase
MAGLERLKEKLNRIDGKGYKAYKDIQGAYVGDGWVLYIDFVQGDPFASPSRIRVTIPQEEAGFHPDGYHSPSRRVAFEDFLAREMAARIESMQRMRGTGNSGLIWMDAPGQEVLPRTAVRMDAQTIEFRLSVGLPAQGRTILGKHAAKMLCEDVPHLVKQTILRLDRDRLRRHLVLADQQEAIRRYLEQHGYVCFIANGAILPRESGISNRPLPVGRAIPFQSPASLEIEVPIPHAGVIRGMAIPKGVSLIVGGGYHGKSTLLQAIERGVYNHVAGDGREFVLTDQTACKVRAEDGRRVEKVNIAPFINQLPFGQDTRQFTTDDASGSTSQAANIMECLEVGCRLLLIDEDTSATNFMIRDARMQELVVKAKEPITPFIDKVRQLYEELGVSTILVVGGSGDYFDVADRVIMMDEYRPQDVTELAKKIAARIQVTRKPEGGERFGEISARVVLPQGLKTSLRKKAKVDAKGLRAIQWGDSRIDLSFVEQLVDPSQTRAIAQMMKYLSDYLVDGQATLGELIDRLYGELEEKGLDMVSPFYGKHPGDLALPRKFELAAAINRLRTLQVDRRR